MYDKQESWKDILEGIKISISPVIFSTWFKETFISNISESGDRLVIEVGCPTSYAQKTIEERYFGVVQETLTRQFNKNCDLTFVVKINPDKKLNNTNLDVPLFNDQSQNKEIPLNILLSTKLRPHANFENFAVSSSNQMAWAGAEAVAKNPGTAYNPFFIWGGVGVGKTHLMNAIGINILRSNPEAKICLCTGEDFTNDIVEGIRNKTTPEFRKKYRKLNTLIIDDIQFIAGKDTAQEEFFHTFNAVTSAGGQIILASDRPPSEIHKLEDRLRSRFEAGLIVDIAAPDFELRCAILQIKSKERGIELAMNEIQLIAANLDSARLLEGFLTRLMSEARLKNKEVSQELIETILGKKNTNDSLKLKANPDEIITAVSKYFSLGKRSLLSESRQKTVAVPRQILMYILRTQLGLPLEEVGRVVDRDHTTVMHAVDKITNLASTSVNIREDLLGIKKLI